jgi:hypothetical protein
VTGERLATAGVGNPLARNPLRAVGIYHQFLRRFRDRRKHEPGAVRQGAIRNRSRVESGMQGVSTCMPTQLPKGLRLLLRRPERSRQSRWDNPTTRPALDRAGREKEKRSRGVSEPGKARQPPQPERCEKPHRPTANRTQPER